jgi:hypothetical protein
MTHCRCWPLLDIPLHRLILRARGAGLTLHITAVALLLVVPWVLHSGNIDYTWRKELAKAKPRWGKKTVLP